MWLADEVDALLTRWSYLGKLPVIRWVCGTQHVKIVEIQTFLTRLWLNHFIGVEQQSWYNFLYHDILYVYVYGSKRWYCDPLPSVLYKSSLPLPALMDFSSCWEVD